ncbi:dynactin subunit 2, putative [Plasmodium chabaudi chabaudi]|uniref:Dynactin subunit 2, putative n=1 Tax=Plasmodium chabaudi chabaudi TaxID=31271 RepID=A0A4V0KCN8_PLACU|nr:dynactin subunit 2, putative [Plasmodium chabaudi chabaudi]VTZ70587.1 dynactin subunit 2, putative [Plasmodium chabaudi chabaudi]|eukprot:XP_738699.2 dynactin subunit 2, putative [Plasmodium chabaudi chabaudi]
MKKIEKKTSKEQSEEDFDKIEQSDQSENNSKNENSKKDERNEKENYKTNDKNGENIKSINSTNNIGNILKREDFTSSQSSLVKEHEENIVEGKSLNTQYDIETSIHKNDNPLSTHELGDLHHSKNDDTNNSLTYGIKLKSKQMMVKKRISKLFGSDHTSNKEDMLHINKNKKMGKENIKVDMRNFFFPSQEKDVFEYIPDTSNYSICHNNSTELYKDVVNMNKHFLDEININIYSSPLDTYLSSTVSKQDNAKIENKILSSEYGEKIVNTKTVSLDEKNTNLITNLNGNKNDVKLYNNDNNAILDESENNKPLYLYEFYKNKTFKCYNNGVIVEIDPSKIRYNDATNYEYNNNMSSYLNDPLSYLQKLKCEIEDMMVYINDIAKNNQTEENTQNGDTSTKKTEDKQLDKNELIEHEQIIKKIMHNREPPEVLLELFALKNDINNILNDDKLVKILKKKNTKKQNDLSKEATNNDNSKNEEMIYEMIKKLQNADTFNDVVKLNDEKTSDDKKIKDIDSFMRKIGIYTLHGDKEKNDEIKDVQVKDLLILERKIAHMEKILGVEKMSMLPYDDLNHAILDLYNKLSLLDSSKLENVKKKMQNLQSEFLNLKKFKKDVLNITKEKGNYEESIDELFKILDVWKKTHHMIPNLLSRLQQLKKIHDNAQSFSTRLDDLEKQQSKLDSTLEEAQKNIDLVNLKINQNVNLLQDMLKKMETQEISLQSNN